MRTREVITVSLPPCLLKEVEDAVEKEGRNKSQLVRDALSMYLADKKWQEYRRDITLKARASGIYTEEDVERIVDAVRTKRVK
jgi:metal-responsive CopG/Arc/MetJ family transcriptional regulator